VTLSATASVWAVRCKAFGGVAELPGMAGEGWSQRYGSVWMRMGTLEATSRSALMRNGTWLNLALNSWMLCLEASPVIASRLSRLSALDGGALAEAQLMVSEKLDALVQLQGMAITGRLGRSPLSAALLSVAHFRRAVASNHSRLSYPIRKSKRQQQRSGKLEALSSGTTPGFQSSL